MRKILATAVVVAAIAGASAHAADRAASLCAATGEGDICAIRAGHEGVGTTTPGGEVTVGERVSWLAFGDWQIEQFANQDCLGAPERTWSSANGDNNFEEIGASNNGGGYYGFCVKATTLSDGSTVLMGTSSTTLAP